MIDYKLDIGEAFGLAVFPPDVVSGIYQLELIPDIQAWCRDVLGYIPYFEHGPSKKMTFEYIHLIFQKPEDAILFKINYGHKWG